LRQRSREESRLATNVISGRLSGGIVSGENVADFVFVTSGDVIVADPHAEAFPLKLGGDEREKLEGRTEAGALFVDELDFQN
jgi:hypothetical protein